jgi:hypothetical protein
MGAVNLNGTLACLVFYKWDRAEAFCSKKRSQAATEQHTHGPRYDCPTGPKANALGRNVTPK